MAKAVENHVEAIDPHLDVIHIVNRHSREIKQQEMEHEERFVKSEQRRRRLRRRRFRKTVNNIGYFASGVGFLGMSLCGFARSYLLWGIFIAVSAIAYVTICCTTK